MKTTFKDFLALQEFVQQEKKIVVENYFGQSGKYLSFLPNIDVSLPEVERRSKIKTVSDFCNPISIMLDDGTKLFFSSDEYRRLHTKPEIGRTMIVRFQRLPQDKSIQPSKITFCQIV